MGKTRINMDTFLIPLLRTATGSGGGELWTKVNEISFREYKWLGRFVATLED